MTAARVPAEQRLKGGAENSLQTHEPAKLTGVVTQAPAASGDRFTVTGEPGGDPNGMARRVPKSKVSSWTSAS